MNISGRAVTRREQWQDPDTSGFVSSWLGVICSMSGGRRVFVHLAAHLLSTVVHQIVDQSMSAKRRERFVRKKIAQVASGFCLGEVRWPRTLSRCLTDLVTGQFTVERLIANTLLDGPENSMLSHAGDQRSAFHTQFCGCAIWSSDHPSRSL